MRRRHAASRAPALRLVCVLVASAAPLVLLGCAGGSDGGSTADDDTPDEGAASTSAEEQALTAATFYEWDSWTGTVGNSFSLSKSASLTGSAYTSGGLQYLDVAAAAGPGTFKISRGFGATEGQWYQAWAKGEVQSGSSCDTRGDVEIHFYDGATLRGRCFAQYTTLPSFTRLDTNVYVTQGSGCGAGGCVVKNATSGACKAIVPITRVGVSFRNRIVSAGSTGTAVLSKLRVARCSSTGSCAAVAPPSGW